MRASAPKGQVAQSVEQGIENPRVGGSIPSLATTPLSLGSAAAAQEPTLRRGRRARPGKDRAIAWPPLGAAVGLGVALLAGCGTDSCERLCVEVGQRLDTCLDEWPTDWGEVDARSRVDFRRTCEDEWSTVRADLEPRELDDGLDQCEDSSLALDRMGRSRTTCDQLRALYLGSP